MTSAGIQHVTSPESAAFVEAFPAEDDVLARARAKAAELEVYPISPAAGASLAFLARLIGAKHVAEIGTGTGVSGLCLFRGMTDDGILTSIDREAENQRVARELFTAAGIASQRFRLIAGSALDVVPRLIENGYDLVYVDGDKVEYGEYLDEAVRVTRPGGLIVFDNALWQGKVADKSQRDAQTSAIRDLVNRVREDDSLESLLLPVGDGLLVIRTR